MLDRADRSTRGDLPAESRRRETDLRRDDGRFERRLERLADGHPSSPRYAESDQHRPGREQRDNRPDERPESSGDHRRDRARQQDHRSDRPGPDLRTDRQGRGWEAPDVRDHPDQPARADTRMPADRTQHALGGDGPQKPGGGHRHGTGKPDKTEFPKDWSDETIVSFVEDVSRRPDEVLWQDNKRWRVRGERDGVNINAVILPDGRIWTAWPDEGGRGVRKNPPEA